MPSKQALTVSPPRVLATTDYFLWTCLFWVFHINVLAHYIPLNENVWIRHIWFIC